MAHVKSGGATRQASKRPGKRRGLKKAGGEKITTGQIIIRQKGMVYKAGKNVGIGRDHTLFALTNGLVQFGKRFGKTVVHVLST
ncbi:MAG TPA: 50S ribosomal protein L27 [Candidatus Pacebacteria bacterium]|nr:MAG: 50S ribosomal protein L27 [Microgenomates group bacterium GW2011_GWB1_45_17]KKU23300.1 MAG: 50S ribosomal protein L27 [Microgenomates group bacterium GW2011_GWA1_46_15]KKU23469.1 MAG: 50S ribosomal protein L27, large subunit ribosomal protein L27 [Microgenomates group bacterium GW2011_GWC1_46_15]HAV15011.1 50S ribosomal protein L27 [Candidatus Paceibacterota bacterium]HCR11157.1 50S ribosomal protein L27 [Candidatus Paceibacterota bacterium]